MVLACLDKVNNQFSGSTNTGELLAYVDELLPLPKDSYKVVTVKGTFKRFKAQVECRLENINTVEKFVRDYINANNETLRKLTPTKQSKKSPYSIILYYRCHRKMYHQPSMNPSDVLQELPSKRFKNNDCPFSMIFRMNKLPISGYTCLLDIEWNHNHVIQAGQSYSFEDIPVGVIERIKNMYQLNYTPGLAYREFCERCKMCL